MKSKEYCSNNVNQYVEKRLEVLETLSSCITPREYRILKRDLLIENDQDFNEASYLQLACETTVNVSFLRKFPETFTYEDKLNGKKDVDCSFVIQGIKFNVEVKCADFSERHEIFSNGNKIKLGFWGRHPDHEAVVGEFSQKLSNAVEGVVNTPNMDNKMKDYLLSAHGKFLSFREDSALNILVVCCDTPSDMSSWVGYLYGNEGLFTEQSFHPSEEYSNVDVILLSNIYHRHYDFYKKNLIADHWSLDSAFNICIPNRNSSLDKYELNKRLSVFYSLVTTHSFEVFEYHHKHYADDLFTGAMLVIPHYVNAELFPNNIFLFQPESKADLED